jgi:hypothetical protein
VRSCSAQVWAAGELGRGSTSVGATPARRNRSADRALSTRSSPSRVASGRSAWSAAGGIPTAAGQFVLYGVGHPDNTTTIKAVSIAGGQPTPVASGYLGDAVWSRDLTRIAVLIGNPEVAGVVQQIEMLDLDSSFVVQGTPAVIYGPTSCDGCLNNLQFARTSDHVIFDGATGVMYEIDADVASPSVATPFAVSGYQPWFNHDDTKIIFRRYSDSHIFVYDISTMIQTAVTPGAAASPDFRAWTP